MRFRAFRGYILISAAGFLLISAAWLPAQTTGEIRGIVGDPANAMVAEAPHAALCVARACRQAYVSSAGLSRFASARTT